MELRFLSEAFLAFILSATIASAQQASDTVAPEKPRWSQLPNVSSQGDLWSRQPIRWRLWQDAT